MDGFDEMEVKVSEVVDYLRVTGQFSQALHKVIARKITVDTAREAGIEVTDEQLQKSADTFRHAHGLHKASDTEEWLKANGLTTESLENHLEENFLISSFKDNLENQANKADYLKVTEIEDTVREAIFHDWLKDKLK